MIFSLPAMADINRNKGWILHPGCKGHGRHTTRIKMKTIHCKKEPTRCQSGYSFCKLDDFGRGHKLPGDATWCGTGKQYKKVCEICDSIHIFMDNSPPPKPPQPKNNSSIFGFHRGTP